MAKSELVSTSLPLLLSPLFIRLSWLVIGNAATPPALATTTLLFTLEFIVELLVELLLALAAAVVVIGLDVLLLLLLWLVLAIIDDWVLMRVLRLRLI